MNDFKPIKRDKLSKKFLMELDTGLYLVSNTYDNPYNRTIPYKSIFSENVVAIEIRKEQWKRIVNARANNRLCDVFLSKENYDKYHLSIIPKRLMI